MIGNGDLWVDLWQRWNFHNFSTSSEGLLCSGLRRLDRFMWSLAECWWRQHLRAKRLGVLLGFWNRFVSALGTPADQAWNVASCRLKDRAKSCGYNIDSFMGTLCDGKQHANWHTSQLLEYSMVRNCDQQTESEQNDSWLTFKDFVPICQCAQPDEYIGWLESQA